MEYKAWKRLGKRYVLFSAQLTRPLMVLHDYNRVSKYDLSTWTILFCMIPMPMPMSIPAGDLQEHMSRSRLIDTRFFGTVVYVVCIIHNSQRQIASTTRHCVHSSFNAFLDPH